MEMRIGFKRAGAASLLLLGAGLTGLSGCGDKGYESEEAFLNEVRHSAENTASDAPGGGTLPPVGESMDHVGRIRVETSELDVGLIANDKPHFTKLKVYNDGKRPLKITDISTSCACTQGQIPPDRAEVPAGGETWIDVMVDPSRIPGFHAHKVLSITSTDPERNVVQVGVTSRVNPEYEIDAEEDIELGEIMKGASLEKRIRFRQLQDNPVTLTRVEPLTTGPTYPKIAGVSAQFSEVPADQWKTPGKREYDIVLTIGPDIPAGPFERIIMLGTDIARFKVQSIYLRGTVMAPYKVAPLYPERATFGRDDAGRIVAHLSFSSASPITLSDISVGNPKLTASVAPSPFADQVGLDVVLDEADPKLELDETLRLKVNVDGRSFDEIVGVRFGSAIEGH